MEIGSTIDGKYLVLGEIGRGGMGTVLRVRRNGGPDVLALKYCHLPNAAARKRFAREARSMERVKHPRVAPVLDVSVDGDPLYFVMPLAESSCAARIHEYAGEEAKALSAFLQICEGVRALHTAGLVHRDIKPDNALVINGQIVISDLGLVRETERQTTVLTQTLAIVGTEPYLAPEQRIPGGSRDADFRTDVFQLGKTLYQMVTGLSPAMIDPSRLSVGLGHVVRRATAEHPSERYQTVGELVDAVTGYLESRDPARNPRQAFENLLGRVTARLRQAQYKRGEVRDLLAVLESEPLIDSPAIWLELFDRLPMEIVEILPQLPAEAERVLRIYVDCLDKAVRGRVFSYAERVAAVCKGLFNAAAGNPAIRALSLEALLIAATRLNRFAAMDILKQLLASITDDQDAWAVREAMHRHPAEFGVILGGIPDVSLHAALRPPVAGDE